VVAFVSGFSQIGINGTITNSENALLFASYGALTGLVFWLIAFANFRSNNSFKADGSAAA
jgi:hypothetical protein